MVSRQNSPLVNGEILLSQSLGSFSGATAHVYLEDVSLQDDSANVITEQSISNIDHEAGIENRVAFSLHSEHGEIAKPIAMYSVRVHITFHQDGRIHRGDYISTESYPVLTQGYPSAVLVRVTAVK